MFDDEIAQSAEALVSELIRLNLWVTTAESCTGGLISAALTSVAGASACVGAGYVTYSDDAKMSALNVAKATLDQFGAVSAEVASEMAGGAQVNAGADLALAVTGIAGPGGGTELKPVGLVYVAASGGRDLNALNIQSFNYGNIGRAQVRRETVLSALKLGLDALNASQ